MHMIEKHHAARYKSQTGRRRRADGIADGISARRVPPA